MSPSPTKSNQKAGVFIALFLSVSRTQCERDPLQRRQSRRTCGSRAHLTGGRLAVVVRVCVRVVVPNICLIFDSFYRAVRLEYNSNQDRNQRTESSVSVASRGPYTLKTPLTYDSSHRARRLRYFALFVKDTLLFGHLRHNRLKAENKHTLCWGGGGWGRHK